MPQYLALTYTADVDWWAPEQASELAEYRQFAVDNADSIRASAVLHPTGTATVVRVEGARGGNVVTTDGPYAETKEALTGYYLHRGGRPGRGGGDRGPAPRGLGRRGRGAPGHRGQVSGRGRPSTTWSPRRSGSRARASSRP